MATDFVYFLSTLPMLRLSGENAPSYAKFRQRCQEMLTDEENAILAEATLVPSPAPSAAAGTQRTISAWNSWATVMLNAIAQWRARRLDDSTKLTRNAVREENNAYPGDLKRLTALLDAPDARQRQDSWEALQWDYLSQLEGGLYFSFDSLVIYALKLQLLEQRRRYSVDEGRNLLDRALTRLMEEASSTRVTES